MQQTTAARSCSSLTDCACKQVLEAWQPSEWRRALQPVARGVAAACGDSAAATRTLGRAMYAALVARAPDAASTALDAMTPTAQRQLFAAASAAPPAPSRSLGSRLASQHSSRPRSQPGSRPDSAGSAATDFSTELVSPVDSAGPYTPAPEAAAAPATPWSRGLPQRVDSGMAHTAQCPATVGARPRRSVGLPQRLSAGPHRTPQPPSRMESLAGAATHAGTVEAPAVRQHPQQRLSAPTGRHSQLGRPPRRISQALPVRETVSDAITAAPAWAQPHPEPGSGCGGAPTIRSLVITIQSAGAGPCNAVLWSGTSTLLVGSCQQLSACWHAGSTECDAKGSKVLQSHIVSDAGVDWGARAAAYDGLRLLLWEARRGAAPALAAEAGALLPLLAEHLGAPAATLQSPALVARRGRPSDWRQMSATCCRRVRVWCKFPSSSTRCNYDVKEWSPCRQPACPRRNGSSGRAGGGSGHLRPHPGAAPGPLPGGAVRRRGVSAAGGRSSCPPGAGW
jgi:hypothetical protein